MKLSTLFLLMTSALLTSSAPLSPDSELLKRACFFNRETGAYSCTNADSKVIPSTAVKPRQCFADSTTGEESCSTNNIEVDSNGTVINPKQRRDEPAQPAASFETHLAARAEKRQGGGPCYFDPSTNQEVCPPEETPTLLCWIAADGTEQCEED